MKLKLALATLCLAVAAPALASDHVRVVLDLSGSMQTNDRRRLATLATVLLRDLANPDPTRGDTFRVLPFDLNVPEWLPPASPPPGMGPTIAADSGTREDFVRAVTALRYDAGYTYFYPGLAAALRDLRGTEAGPAHRRVIVLVTDGVPQSKTRAQEEELLRREIAPELLRTGTRLYVLAFGQEASAERAFFDRLAAGVGEVFVDADGSGLLATMTTVFATSFGYTAEPPQRLQASNALNLEGGQSPTEVAVVAFGPSSAPVPFELRPTGNAPAGVQRAQEIGGAYALQWTLQPRPGRHTLLSWGEGGSVTVIRPTRLQLALRPRGHGVRRDLAIARVPLPLDVVVSPATGGGDPGDIDVSYVVCVPSGGSQPRCSNPLPPAIAAGAPEGAGRVYAIAPVFFADATAGTEFSRAQLHVTALRSGVVVASLTQAVAVYPFVRLAPSPPVLTIPPDRTPMAHGERGCASFTLQLDSATLPHEAEPTYAVKVTVSPASAADPSFAGATFTLDGKPLDVDASPGPAPGPWYTGVALGRDALLGSHELCVTLGRPRGSASSNVADVALVVRLAEPPYDGYELLAAPISAGVLVAAPSWIERNGAVSALLLGLICLVLMAWFGRNRGFLARELCCELWSGSGIRSSGSDALGPERWWARLFGLTSSRALLAPDGSVVGSLAPVRHGLFRLRLGRGARLEDDTGAPVSAIQAHRRYVVRGQPGISGIRVSYE